MKSIKIAMSLVFASFLLAACGGGGDARSPDRPGLSIDPTTMRLEFVPPTKFSDPEGKAILPGTGNNEIRLRMMALRSDGVNKNVGPEQNITDQVNWSLTLERSGLAAIVTDTNGDIEVTTVPSFGKVIKIASTQRLTTNDAASNGTVKGVFKGTSVPGFFEIRVPEKKLGLPSIVSPELQSDDYEVLLDPSIADHSKTASFRVLQDFKDDTLSSENITDKYLLCSSNNELAEPNPSVSQPVSRDDRASVPFIFKSPFSNQPGANNLEQTVTLFAVKEDSNATCPASPPAGAPRRDVNIKPASFSQVDICVVVNQTACNENGRLIAQLESDCDAVIDLPSDQSVNVPAEQQLQFVARKTFTREVEDDDEQLVEKHYLCNDGGNAVWSSRDGDLIYSVDVDPVFGSAATVDDGKYEELKAAGGIALKSEVTGTFGSEDALKDTLKLQLVSARVESVSIERLSPAANNEEGTADKPDVLYINSFLDGIQYRALCKFAGETELPCPTGRIAWSTAELDGSAAPNLGTLKGVNGGDGTKTITTYLTGGSATSDGDIFNLALSYTGGDTPQAAAPRVIKAVDPGTLTTLRLFMVPNARDPQELREDEFACVGRDDLVQTLEDGEQVQGGQQFEAYAEFSNLQGADVAPYPEQGNARSSSLHREGDILGATNDSDTRLLRVTDQSNVSFQAIPGFWSGAFQDPPGCQTAITEDIPIGDLSGATDGLIATPADPAARFPDQATNPEDKGRLSSVGLLRLSTVCVQAFADETPNTDDDELTASKDGATVLVLPAADDDLLEYSEELCETLEPVLTFPSFPGLGAPLPGLVLPVVYGVSLVADPLLATLIQNGEGEDQRGIIPGEQIVNALIDGDFSRLDPSAPDIGAGLGDLTHLLLTGGDQLPAGLNVIVDAVDACLVAPVTSVVGGLLGTILSFDIEDFQNFDETFYDDCINLFGDLAP